MDPQLSSKLVNSLENGFYQMDNFSNNKMMNGTIKYNFRVFWNIFG